MCRYRKPNFIATASNSKHCSWLYPVLLGADRTSWSWKLTVVNYLLHEHDYNTCCSTCEWRGNELFCLLQLPPLILLQCISWVLGKDLVFPNGLFHGVLQSPSQKGSKTTSCHKFELIILFSLQVQPVPLFTLPSCWGLMPYLPQDSLPSVSLRPKTMPVCCLHGSASYWFWQWSSDAFLRQ